MLRSSTTPESSLFEDRKATISEHLKSQVIRPLPSGSTPDSLSDMLVPSDSVTP